jgi:hypothetical protein
MNSRRKTADALAGLSRRVPEGMDLLMVISGAENERDRSEALVRGALVQDALQRAILNQMRALDAPDVRRLFGPNAPLSSFYGQIAVAYAIKIIGPRTRDDFRLYQRNPERVRAHHISHRIYNSRSRGALRSFTASSSISAGLGTARSSLAANGIRTAPPLPRDYKSALDLPDGRSKRNADTAR